MLSATHLNELTSPIISNEACGSQRYWGDQITPNMVCASYRRHGVCVGESGGPLVCNNNAAGPYSLVGVTSFVPPHCRNPDGKKPSVFTNVFNYIEWIKTTILNCTGYIRSDNGHCYKFVKEKMTYAQAEEYCQAEGSYLVEIGSQLEQYFLQRLVGYRRSSAWIGLQDKGQNGNWSLWNSGAPVEYSKWGYGQPNNWYGVEYCGELATFAYNGKWHDKNCDLKQKFVCERSSNQAFLASRKCYSFHEERKNYSEAQDVCASMGGHLVEINSEYEQLLLKGIFNNNAYLGRRKCYSSWIWIGLNNHSNDGNRRTWNSGANITYSNWGSGESAYKLWHRWQSTNCVVMDSYGKWQDSVCDTKLRFLCENNIFTSSSKYVHTLCNFDVKEQMIADVNRPFPIGAYWGPYCSYFCSEDGHCYNHVEIQVTYSAAEEFCRSEGSYLVEIGSPMEQYFIQGLILFSWMGLQDKDQSGNWSHWNSGAPVEYSNWHHGQPNNQDGMEYCGGLNNYEWNGEWNVKNCDDIRPFVCEHGSNQASNMSGKCYSYHKEEKNYDDAHNICTSEGGHLLEINSQWEQIFTYEWTNGSIWLGLNDLYEEGNWTKWYSGATVTYSNWLSREPDNGKGVNCGEMLMGLLIGLELRVASYKWQVTMGGFKRVFICEQSRNTTSFSRDDPRDNCKYSPNCCSNDTCYTYHDTLADCLEAQDICAAEKGYLLEINTKEEQALLKRWQFLYRGRIYGWIGLSDKDEQGNWKKWNSGAPVTYSNWDEGEPNIDKDQHTKEAEHCAEMIGYDWNDGWKYNGKWNDLKCDRIRRFVCENTRLTTSSKNTEVVCGDSG